MNAETYVEKVELYKSAQEAYYEFDDPIMSDQEFDKLEKEIKALLKQQPNLPSLSGIEDPTTSVGGRASSGFGKVKHKVPMLSLAKAHTDDEVEDWLKQIERFLK